MKVKRTGTKYINKLSKALREQSSGVVSVGIQKGEKYPDGTNLAMVAVWNEFGTENIPERPFIRSTLFVNKDYVETKKKLAKAIIEGKYTLSQSLEVLGLKVQQDIQNTIVELKSPKNAPFTIKKKKSSNPLIDSGLMLNSVSYVVKK